MRTNAIYNILFNRKNKILKPDDTALIQLDILFTDKKHQYISTGFYLHKNEWDPKNKIVINNPSSAIINKQLSDLISKLRSHELKLNELDVPLTRKSVTELLEKPDLKKNSFIAFMVHEIAHRKEIHVKTRSRHTLITKELKKLNIIYFSDLTLSNIEHFDQYLKDHLEPTTVFKKHQNLKTYIHKAIDKDMMRYEDNPYHKFKVPRGKHQIRTRLDSTEMDLMISKPIEDANMNYLRKLYVFMMFTGLSFTDMNFTSSQIRSNNKKFILEGLRKKNGEYYTIPLLPPAYEIIQEFGTGIPDGSVFNLPSYEQFKRNLKIVAATVVQNPVILTT